MVVGVVKVVLDCIKVLLKDSILLDYSKLIYNSSVVEVEFYCMEVDWEVVCLLIL